MGAETKRFGFSSVALSDIRPTALFMQSDAFAGVLSRPGKLIKHLGVH
jgi:hypothetical protein